MDGSILFSAMHMQFYGFIPRLLLGAMLGYLLFWAEEFMVVNYRAFVNNAAAIIFTFLFQHRVSSIDVDTVRTKEGDVLSVPN